MGVIIYYQKFGGYHLGAMRIFCEGGLLFVITGLNCKDGNPKARERPSAATGLFTALTASCDDRNVVLQPLVFTCGYNWLK